MAAGLRSESRRGAILPTMKHAKIYRMVTPRHLCPWGVKATDLLKRNGFEVEDHHLESEEKNEAFKKEHGFKETPQIYLEGEHLGGYDALRRHLGLGPDPKTGESYQPIVAVFGVTALMAVTACWSERGELSLIRGVELFVALSMCVLGILKLRDLRSFATGFVQYDLVARRWVPYSSIYAFVETGAGILMIGSLAPWITVPATLAIGSVGAVSVFKAVYLEKRDLNCACVGGGSTVPLGFISLTENLMMIGMAVWMTIKALGT